jgi:ribosome-binding factor A
MDAARARKLADRIAQIVAEMLERRIKDPRLGFVTVTDARLTGDLRDATVFYTVYGPAEEQAATAVALESAKGVIRSEIGRQTGLRHTPSLTFVADTVPDTARHIEELIEQARAADAGVALSREGALPAGDPDPYRPAPGSAAAGEDDAEGAEGAAEGEDAQGILAAGRGQADGDGGGGDLPQSARGADHQAGYSAS